MFTSIANPIISSDSSDLDQSSGSESDSTSDDFLARDLEGMVANTKNKPLDSTGETLTEYEEQVIAELIKGIKDD